MKTAAIFLINKNFITPFEVFIHSMVETGSFTGIPLLVVTTDQEVADDAFVRSVCHDVRVIGPDEADRFKMIKSEAVPVSRAHEEVAAYYFFKFAIFSETRFDRLIYFDVDMLCMGNIDPLLTMEQDADICGAPAYGAQDMKFEDGSDKPLDRRERIAERALSKSMNGKRPREKAGMNSGLLIINRRLLSERTTDALLSMASEDDFTGDQNVLCSLIARDPDLRFSYLSQFYNAPRRIFDRTSIRLFMKTREDLKILHFNAKHPWNEDENKSFVDFIWWDAYRRSRPFVAKARAAVT